MRLRFIEPFGEPQRLQIANPQGHSLGELLVGYADAVEACVVDGQIVERWQELCPTDERIDLCLKAGFFGTVAGSAALAKVLSAAITAAIAVAVSTGISLAVAALSGKPVGKETGRPEEVFGIAGLTNTVALGTSKFSMYGKRRVYGHIISTQADLAEDGRRMNFAALYFMGEGEVDSLSKFQINDTEISQFPGVTTATRLGTATQDVIPGFENVDQVFSDGRSISGTPLIYTGHGSTFDGAYLFFSTPFLFNLENKTGRHNAAHHTIRVEHKKFTDPETSWTEAAGLGTSSVSPLEWVDNSDGLLFRAFSITLPSKAQWQFRLTLLDSNNQEAVRPSLYNVLERESTTKTYPHSSLLAIFSVASSQIQSFEAMRCSAEVKGRKCRVWNGVFYETKWTDNRVWIVRELLTNSRVGLGNRIKESLWNDTAALTAANFYDELVPAPGGGTEKRDRCDVIVNDRRPGWDWIKEIAREGRALVMPSDGQLKYVVDRAREKNLLYSMPGNIVEGTLQTMLGGEGNLPNTFRGEFPDQARNDKLNVIEVVASNIGSEPTREELISLRTVTRESHAFRELTYQLKKRRLVKRRWTWTSPSTALVSEPLDVDALSYLTVNTKRGSSGFCPSGSTISTLVLDRLVTLDAGRTYELLVRHQATNSMERTTVATGTGTWGIVAPSMNFTTAPAEGDIWAIGEQNVHILPVLIEEVKQNGTGDHRLIASEYQAAIYDSEPLPPASTIRPPIIGPIPIPLLDASVSEGVAQQADGSTMSVLKFQVAPGMPLRAGIARGGTPTSMLMALGEPEIDDYFIGARLKIISGTGASQEALIMDYVGAERRALVNTSWIVIPDVTSFYEARFEGFEPFAGFDVEGDDVHGVFFPLISGWGTVLLIPFRGLPDIRNFRFTPFSANGTRNLHARWIKQLTLVGDTIKPDPPSGLRATGTFRAISLTWSKPNDIDLEAVEAWSNTVNQREPAGQPGGASLVGEGMDGFFHGALGDGETRYYWIRARDHSGNVSDWHPFDSSTGVRATTTLIDFSAIDQTPPQAPTGLILSAGTMVGSDGSIVAFVNADWNDVIADDLDHYQVNFHVNLSIVPTVMMVTASHARLTGLPGNIPVAVRVAAVDRVGNVSAFTPLQTVTTPGDTAAPGPISNLIASPSFQSVGLLWSPSSDADYTHAEVWASKTNNRATAAKVAEGFYSATHSGLKTSETWYYWLISKDTSGNPNPVSLTTGNWYPASPTTGVVATTIAIQNPDLADRSISIQKLLGDARSLAENSDFEAGNAGWFGVGLANFAIQQHPNARNGAWAAVKSNGGGTGALRNLGIVVARPGDQFYISAFLRTDPGANGQGHVRVDWLDEHQAEIGNGGGNLLSPSTAYTESSGIVTAPNGTVYARAELAIYDHTTGTWYADDVLFLTAVYANLIAANQIQAQHLVTDTAVITTAAQIANAIIGSAKITDLVADKITAGVLTVLISIAAGNLLLLDGTVGQLTVKDPAGNIRVQIGHIPGIDFGMRVFSPTGALMFSATGGASGGLTTAGISDAAVTATKIAAGTVAASHLRADTAVITNSAQIDTAIINTAHIKDLSVDTLKIADNAVTTLVNTSPKNIGAFGGFGTQEREVDRLTITTSGPLSVMAHLDAIQTLGGGEPVECRIRRDGVLLGTFAGAPRAGNGPGSMFVIDAPSSGFHTYQLTVQALEGVSWNLVEVWIAAMNFKK